MRRKNKFIAFLFLLSQPFLLSASNSESLFRLLTFTIEPIEKGKDYYGTAKMRSFTSNKDVSFWVSIYPNNPLKDLSACIWECSYKRTAHYSGEEMIYDYCVPKEYIIDHFYIAFGFSYSYYNSNGYPGLRYSIQFAEIDSYVPTYSKIVTLGNGSQIKGSMSARFIENHPVYYYRPTLELKNYETVLEKKNGIIPLPNALNLSFYNESDNSPISASLSGLQARLQVIGKEAKEFASFADGYRMDYRGGIATFYLDILETEKGKYRFILPEKKFVINRFTGAMRISNAPTKDEAFTRELYLPHHRENEKMYSMRIFTNATNQEYNIPHFETMFSLYSGNNIFGNCVNSDYCIGANYE